MAGRDESRQSHGAPGWFATLLGMALLVAAGFGVGLVVGVISQEPTLVIGHLMGHDEEVAWTPDSEPSITEPAELEPDLGWRPAVAEPPLEPGPAAGAPTWEESATPLAERLVPEEEAAGEPTESFVVQVGAFSDSAAAERMSRTLAAKGYAAYVTPSPASASPSWRVRVGPVGSREKAQQLARRLKLEERLPTWVVGEEGE